MLFLGKYDRPAAPIHEGVVGATRGCDEHLGYFIQVREFQEDENMSSAEENIDHTLRSLSMSRRPKISESCWAVVHSRQHFEAWSDRHKL